MLKLRTLIIKVQLTIGWQENIHTPYYNEYSRSQHNQSKKTNPQNLTSWLAIVLGNIASTYLPLFENQNQGQITPTH